MHGFELFCQRTRDNSKFLQTCKVESIKVSIPFTDSTFTVSNWLKKKDAKRSVSDPSESGLI